MTVSSENNKNTYPGNGSTTVFAFTFSILDETHFSVEEINDTTGEVSVKQLTTDYTVSGTGNDQGRTNYTSGDITMLVAPTSGVTLVIKRDIPFLQGTDYVENDRFPADSHEEALDYLTMISQQLIEQVEQSIKFESSVTFPGNLPPPSAAKYLRTNSTNTGWDFVTVSDGSGLGAVVDDPSPALGGHLDTNGFNIDFDDGLSIRDENKNKLIETSTTPSSVNHMIVANAATGNGPTVSAAGSDTNVDLNLSPKGTGKVLIENAAPTIGVKGVATDINLRLEGKGAASNVVLSPAANVDGVLILKNHISFPATQVPSSGPNDLDDYEEGTWTPTVSPGLNATAATVTNATYIKIGRFVKCEVKGTITITAFGLDTSMSFNAPFPMESATDSGLWGTLFFNWGGRGIGNATNSTTANNTSVGLFFPATFVGATGMRDWVGGFAYRADN